MHSSERGERRVEGLTAGRNWRVADLLNADFYCTAILLTAEGRQTICLLSDLATLCDAMTWQAKPTHNTHTKGHLFMFSPAPGLAPWLPTTVKVRGHLGALCPTGITWAKSSLGREGVRSMLHVGEACNYRTWHRTPLDAGIGRWDGSTGCEAN